MLILGLLLLACTAAFTGLALADNLSGGPDYDVTVLGHHLATMNSLAIFCAGLALALIFCLSCVMTMAGGVLHRRKSRKRAAARRDARATARERDELAARLAESDDRSGTTAYPADEGPGYPMEPISKAEPAGAERADTPGRRHHARHLFGH